MSTTTVKQAGDPILDFARLWVSDVERAGAAAAAELGQLLTDDGRKFYSDEQHARLEREAHARLGEALAGAEAKAAETKAAAEREADALADSDPFGGLTTEETTRAAALAPLIREEVEALGLEALARRVLSIRDAGDGVQKLLYSRYVGRRLAAMGPLERPGRLAEVADQMEEQALPERAALRDRLRRRVLACRDVEQAVRRQRLGVGGGMERLEQELRAFSGRGSRGV